MMRREAAEARAERQAERELRQTQGTNEANLFADLLKGRGVSGSALSDMVRTQQISLSGMHAYLAMSKRGEGEENAGVLLDLYKRLATGDLTVDDVYRAGKAGQLKPGTAGNLMLAVGRQDTKGNNQVDRANFDQLKTLLGGHNIEKGLVDLTNEAGRRQSQLWAQAQGEWTQRVIVGGEDSGQVLGDMAQRYQPNALIPAWLSVPRAGTISSLQDAQVAAQRTVQMHAAGQINDQQFAAEKSLIAQYAQFYQQQQARQAAAAAIRASSAPQSGDKAKAKARPVGVSQ
jgi:hypothetical protein